jgi:2'-5' RNA ligase
MAPAVHDRVAQLKRGLAATGAAVRWTRDEGLHLTLKFLGSATVARLDAVRDALAPLLAEVASFSAHVAGLGVFPRPERPRIVWVGIQASELARLAGLVEGATSKLGFHTEERPFHGHITLGRIKDRRGWAALAAALNEHWHDDFGSFEVRHIIAFRSDLQRDGSVYSELWNIQLAACIGGGDYGIRRESRACAGSGRQPD